MSNYKHQINFVTRTLTILNDLEPKTKFEKTLFLNCCLGLLVAPQQWDQCIEHDISEEMNVDTWFIDTHAARPNVYKKGKDEYSVENFAYHLRNSLCHHLFSVLGDSEQIRYIEIVDYTDSNHSDCSFRLKVSFDALKQFVVKYATTKVKLFKNNPAV